MKTATKTQGQDYKDFVGIFLCDMDYYPWFLIVLSIEDRVSSQDCQLSFEQHCSNRKGKVDEDAKYSICLSFRKWGYFNIEFLSLLLDSFIS